MIVNRKWKEDQDQMRRKKHRWWINLNPNWRLHSRKLLLFKENWARFTNLRCHSTYLSRTWKKYRMIASQTNSYRKQKLAWLKRSKWNKTWFKFQHRWLPSWEQMVLQRTGCASFDQSGCRSVLAFLISVPTSRCHLWGTKSNTESA